MADYNGMPLEQIYPDIKTREDMNFNERHLLIPEQYRKLGEKARSRGLAKMMLDNTDLEQ